MSLFKSLCAAALLTVGAAAQAATINYSSTTNVGNTNFPSVSSYFGGAATDLLVDLSFEVGTGTPGTASISGGSGTVSWGAGNTFTATSAGSSGAASNGRFTVSFQGSGPNIGGSFLSSFFINFDLGVNPFTSADQLSELLTGASILNNRAGVSQGNGTQFSTLGAISDVSITEGAAAVPAPASLALVILAIFGALSRRRLLRA